MRRGLRGATSSYSSFRRLRAGCGVLRMRTSAHWTSRSSTGRAAGDLRSSTTPRLLRLVRCQGYASFDTGCGGMLFALRQRSPAGGSTLIQSGPKSDRMNTGLVPALKPDQARPALRSAGAGQQAELDFGLAELRRLRGDPEGAGERRLAAAAEREAVHRGDHGFAEVLDQLEHALSEAARLPRFERAGVGE